LRGQHVGTGQASGLIPSPGALPLRDSAGISPASLGQRRPGWTQDNRYLIAAGRRAPSLAGETRAAWPQPPSVTTGRRPGLNLSYDWASRTTGDAAFPDHGAHRLPGPRGDTGRSSDMAEAEHDLVVPEGGFWPAPAIPQPNIYPMEWRVETAKLAAIYEKSKLTLWNPADLPWDGL